MHVLSRRCLRNELVLPELTNVGDIVLLLGGRPALCRQIAQAAIELLRTHCGRTRIHLLANDPAQAGAIAAQLAEAGTGATVLTRIVQGGAPEADYLEATLAAAEHELQEACPSWRGMAVPLAA